MKRTLTFFLSLTILFGFVTKAQSIDSIMIQYVSEHDSAGFLYFKPATLTPGQPFAMYQSFTGDSLHKLELKKQWIDSILGMEHFRYQETYRNLKVEAAEYTEHAEDGCL